MNTYDYKKLDEKTYKNNTKNHWNADPCGTFEMGKDFTSKDYFKQLTATRYGNEPWILEELDSLGVKGKKVLEIGFGMGTDHIELARRGGGNVWYFFSR